MGLIGGLMGIAPMAIIASAVLENPTEIGREFAVVAVLMSFLYTPAVWASVARTELRQPILRGSVVASLVIAFVGSVIFGFVVLVLLMPATALLAIAGRLVFSR